MDDLTLSLLEYLKLLLFLINVVIAAVIIFRRSTNGGGEAEEVRRGPVLFVTAHPDDEAMFFVPAILSLAKLNRDLHLLCVSTGDFEGATTGKVRVKELHASAKVLNIRDSNVKVVDDKDLRDGPQNRWDSDKIAQLVRDYVNEKAIETVITFDEGGVSAHPNHISVYHGVARFLALHESTRPSSAASSTAPPGSTLTFRGSASSTSSPPSPRGELRGFKLETTNLLRKYAGLLHLVWSSWTSEGAVFLTPWLSFWPSHRAMQAHHSQYVWFRRLYVPFSRYSYINTLLPISVPNATPTSSPSNHSD
jgi:N-acetylglucosaminylphosphatidylinositol deacetylase